MREHTSSIILGMLALVTIVLAIFLAGCATGVAAGGDNIPPGTTGLVVEIDYSGDVASVEISGAAESTGRVFGPYTLSTAKLGSGDTVGLVFDRSDAGGAMVCAQSRRSDGRTLDSSCGMFNVRAGEISHGSLQLEDRSR